MGDLLTTADTIPLIVNYDDGGSWAEWTRSVDSLLQMDWDTAIPGHGPTVTKQQVREIRAKMVAIQERVRSMNRERKSPTRSRSSLSPNSAGDPGWHQLTLQE